MARARKRNRGSASGTDPLWSKAPLVLLRYPGLFVSIAVGALLLALAASAYPLFISSSASELVAARIHDSSYTRWAVGMMYRNGALPLPGPGRHGDIEPRVDAIFQGLVDASPYLGDPLESALGPVTPISVAGGHERRDTRLFMGWQAPVLRDLTLQEAEDAARITSRISDEIDDRALLDRCFVTFLCNRSNGPV